jgi:hypothetical protein
MFKCLGVRIAQWVQGRDTGSKARVRFQAVQDFSIFHSVHTDPGAHPASYLMSSWGSLTGVKAAEA